MSDLISVLIEHSAELALVDPALKAVGSGAVSLAKDWIGPERLDAIKDVFSRAADKLKRRGSTPVQPSLSILLPLLDAAQDEGRTELRDMWASLLAAAADPARLGIFRRDFIDVAKQLEPIDAAALHILFKTSGSHQPGRLELVAGRLKVSKDQVHVSFQKLRDLKLVTQQLQPSEFHPVLEALGRQFMDVLAD